MTEKKYCVHDLVKFNYSEIGEYIGKGYTDKPLRNDEIVDLLNNYDEVNKSLSKELQYGVKKVQRLAKENEQLKQFKKKVFVLLDKEISRNEEAIEWGKEVGADSGSVGFYNHMLKRLKKELQE